MAAVSLKSQRRWNELKELFEKQGGRCFYSDEILIPGVNASLDHQLPQCRGGDNSPQNIQWVTSDINRVKGKKTHEEFVEMCRHIAEKFS
jgi:CRISPR/Cas system Type II protein with McrA/HNH and RuvC-like nuclease domain